MTGLAPGPEYVVDWAGPVDLPLTDERTVQAACGVMHVHGRQTGRPEPLAIPYATAVAGVLAQQGVRAVELARLRGLDLLGVEVSVAGAALFALTQYLACAGADGPVGVGQVGVGQAGAEPAGVGPVGVGPPFTSADGVRFEVETFEAERWHRFWLRVGVPDRPVRLAWRSFQLRFATATCALPPELPAAAGGLPFDALVALGAEQGVGVVEVRDDHRPPDGGAPWSVEAVGPPVDRALAEAAELPLDGLVVVESTNRVQGPLAGHVLRLLGAQVVRVEPPGGDPMRGVPPTFDGCSVRFRALNDGKSAVELDLKSSAGRAGVRELVAGADVFLHNWAPGRDERWGLTAEDLVRVRPGLVWAGASGWGSAMGSDPPMGTDYLVQARSGLAAALRPDGVPAAPSLMTLTDVLGGLVCAAGVVDALVRRVRTGRGRRVDSSLWSATRAVPRPQYRPRWTDLDRPIATADGYVVMSSRGERIPVCTDLAALSSDPAFARAIGHRGYAYPLPPWRFS
jgi:crotonobetainyl-CoA:carnitine CoA-transferase CaiB-like acyl-CoA transferase